MLADQQGRVLVAFRPLASLLRQSARFHVTVDTQKFLMVVIMAVPLRMCVAAEITREIHLYEALILNGQRRGNRIEPY